MKNTPLVFLIATSLLGSIAVSRCVSADESHPGLGIEAMYSDAVLAYNKKQTDQALQILDQILKEQPNHVEALELKALTLKEKGDPAQALDTYQRLATLKPEKDRGPYLFASGVILNNQLKKPVEARADFEKALALGFNAGACHLFLGIISFNSGDYSAAGAHFDELRSEGATDMKVIANYYLGLIDFKNGEGPSGTAHLVTAKNLAEKVPENPAAIEILKGADKILEPFKRSIGFGNITVLAGYDSNVAQIPSGSNAQNTASGASTPKATLAGAIGYMTPSISAIQWIPSYRFNGNFNTSGDPNSKNFEFATNTGSMFFNYHPLEATSGGLKLEANLIFENQVQNDGSSSFQEYAVTSEMGPFVKIALTPRWKLELELYARPGSFNITPGLGGMDSIARATLKNESKDPYFNFGASLSYEDYVANDDNFKFLAPDFGVSDILHFTAADTVLVSADYEYFGYNSANPIRFDNQLLFHVTETHLLASAGWSILGDLSFTDNMSNLSDVYSYTRVAVMAGVSKSF